jgi:hypothetical protein
VLLLDDWVIDIAAAARQKTEDPPERSKPVGRRKSELRAIDAAVRAAVNLQLLCID